MARKAARRAPRRAPAAKRAADPRERIVDALMRLAAGRRFAVIGLADVAVEAGVSLSELRAHYDGKHAILADTFKRVDRAVLDAGPAEGEGARDRLFDVLMRRFDALAPHKAALRRILRAGRCDPMLARTLYGAAKTSMRWMLAGADIRRGGIAGMVAVRGGVAVFAEAVTVWLDDDDPGLARTMAALDRALRRGERAMALVDEVCELAAPFVGARGARGPQAG